MRSPRSTQDLKQRGHTRTGIARPIDPEPPTDELQFELQVHISSSRFGTSRSSRAASCMSIEPGFNEVDEVVLGNIDECTFSNTGVSQDGRVLIIDKRLVAAAGPRQNPVVVFFLIRMQNQGVSLACSKD